MIASLDVLLKENIINKCLHSSIILHDVHVREISYPFPRRAGVETWGGRSVANGKLGAVLELMLG